MLHCTDEAQLGRNSCLHAVAQTKLEKVKAVTGSGALSFGDLSSLVKFLDYNFSSLLFGLPYLYFFLWQSLCGRVHGSARMNIMCVAIRALPIARAQMHYARTHVFIYHTTRSQGTCRIEIMCVLWDINL